MYEVLALNQNTDEYELTWAGILFASIFVLVRAITRFSTISLRRIITQSSTGLFGNTTRFSTVRPGSPSAPSTIN